MIIFFIKSQKKYNISIEEIEFKIRSIIKSPIEEKINKSKREINLKFNRIKIEKFNYQNCLFIFNVKYT